MTWIRAVRVETSHKHRESIGRNEQEYSQGYTILYEGPLAVEPGLLGSKRLTRGTHVMYWVAVPTLPTPTLVGVLNYQKGLRKINEVVQAQRACRTMLDTVKGLLLSQGLDCRHRSIL